MILNWLVFIAFSTVTYIGISIFAQLTGGQNTTIWQAGLAAIKPIPLLIGVIANIFFGMAIYTGFKITKFSIPMSISIGVIVSELYSIAILGGVLTIPKLVGTALILVGIFLVS